MGKWSQALFLVIKSREDMKKDVKTYPFHLGSLVKLSLYELVKSNMYSTVNSSGTDFPDCGLYMKFYSHYIPRSRQERREKKKRMNLAHSRHLVNTVYMNQFNSNLDNLLSNISNLFWNFSASFGGSKDWNHLHAQTFGK